MSNRRGRRPRVRRDPAALPLVALGTALVLVTYVTPMATVAGHGRRPRRRRGGPRLDPELDERRSGRRPARHRRPGGHLRPPPGVRRRAGARWPSVRSLCAVAAGAAAVRGRPGRSRASAAPPSWPAAWPCSPTSRPGPARVHATSVWGASVGLGHRRRRRARCRPRRRAPAGASRTPSSRVLALALLLPSRCADCPSRPPRTRAASTSPGWSCWWPRSPCWCPR